MIDIQAIDVVLPKILKRRELKSAVKQLIVQEGKVSGDIALVFCSDEHLLEVNKQYLQHDYYTDIITFDYTEANKISGDLMISLDRVRENALLNKVSDWHEINRIVFHGVLHLCGYNDKKPADKSLMTEKENFYLNQFYF